MFFLALVSYAQQELQLTSVCSGDPATERRWRVTNYDRSGMGTALYLSERHFPNVYSCVVH